MFVVHPGIAVPAEARNRWHNDRLAASIDAELAREQGWKVGDRVMLSAARRGPVFRAGALLSALAALAPSIGIAREDLIATLRG